MADLGGLAHPEKAGAGSEGNGSRSGKDFGSVVEENFVDDIRCQRGPVHGSATFDHHTSDIQFCPDGGESPANRDGRCARRREPSRPARLAVRVQLAYAHPPSAQKTSTSFFRSAGNVTVRAGNRVASANENQESRAAADAAGACRCDRSARIVGQNCASTDKQRIMSDAAVPARVLGQFRW